MNDEASESLTTETTVSPDGAIRVGSPFAVDPPERLVTTSGDSSRSISNDIEAFYDVGTIRYTAMGAVLASVMVLGFGGVAAWWFPAGGVMIAALGCGLSLFGMASVYRFTSIGLLVAHLGMFLYSYSRAIG